MSRPPLDGILLEGLNYGGKSTVARLLAQKLRERGDPVRTSHCYVCQDDLNRLLEDRALASVQDWESRPFPDAGLLRAFNVYKSAQMIIDTYLLGSGAVPADDAGVILIQDRHWFTQYCSNEFFTRGEGLLGRDWIRSSAPLFTLHVYLTCSRQTRMRRAQESAPRQSHNLNAYLLAHLEELDSYERHCLGWIPDDRGWMVISTDDMSGDAVANRILGVFGAR